MTPALLRQLWSLVENAQATTILNQDDSSLVQWLLARLGEQRSLATDEVELVGNYIQSRILLIREIAAAQ